MKRMKNYLALFIFGLLVFSCESGKHQSLGENNNDNIIPYTVRMTYQHDKDAFTQGLVFHEGRLYEGTGFHRLRKSWIAEVDLSNGKQDKKVELDKQFFGEGITVLNNKLYQLTWKEKIGFIYDLKTFKNIGSFPYMTEGWGLTTDAQHLILSDGTDRLYFLDTLNFHVVKTISVKENNIPVHKLNELEFINGYIFANQWETNFIAKIDPETGNVVGKIDLSPLVNEVKRSYHGADVLNGIAYNAKTGDILVTGKLWPKSYLIRLAQ